MLTKDYFLQVGEEAKRVSDDEVFTWLVRKGYYPESWVLPDFFDAIKITDDPPRGKAEQETFAIPKSNLTSRYFGIIHPLHFREICKEISSGWTQICEHCFSENRSIYSYSFPLSSGIVENEDGTTSIVLEATMQGYEFVKMNEADLVADSAGYRYVLHTDVKNFYPSIYTHSIAWALHGKEVIRSGSNRTNMGFLGNRLDKCFQQANDGRTNGIPIGPTPSDIVAEIILSAVDLKVSEHCSNVTFFGARFKDDYRFLCKDKSDANKILRTLQESLQEFNLNINESKTSIQGCPTSLYREHAIEYSEHSLAGKDEIPFKLFERTYFKVLEINEKHRGKGTIDKFLRELITPGDELKVQLNEGEGTAELDGQNKIARKFINLIWHLQREHPRALPNVLRVISILTRRCAWLKESGYLEKFFKEVGDEAIHNPYVACWILHFCKKHGVAWPAEMDGSMIDNPFYKSILEEKFLLFHNLPSGTLLCNPEAYGGFEEIDPKDIPF